MPDQGRSRRPAGTGSLSVRADRAGRETWYGKWREGDRQVKRALGPVRRPGSIRGLTRREAEALLRRSVDAAACVPATRERLSLAEAGECYLRHVEEFGRRRRSTVQDYRIVLRRHLAPFFAGRSLDPIDRRAVEAYQATKLRAGLAPKTVSNHVRLLHGISRPAMGRGWVAGNPVAGIEHPGDRTDRGEIRALTVEELEALIGAVARDLLGPTDRPVPHGGYDRRAPRRAAGPALDRRGLDQRGIRVRRSFGRGDFSAPKSRRSFRAVPMPDRVAAELARHHTASAFAGDGRPCDASRLRERFQAALRAAGLREPASTTFVTPSAPAWRPRAPLRFIQE